MGDDIIRTACRRYDAGEDTDAMDALARERAKHERQINHMIEDLHDQEVRHDKQVADLRKQLTQINDVVGASMHPLIAGYEQQIADLRQRIGELEAQLETIKNATCLTCGRSLAPDGDCYGCEVDRLSDCNSCTGIAKREE
jgi:polyhydroxyalkanoate synthesis regulator phasin